MKLNEIIQILKEIRILIESESTDITWSRYSTVEDVLFDIDLHIEHLEKANLSKIKDLKLLFAPTGSFQEISISSGWDKQFLTLADRFDKAI